MRINARRRRSTWAALAIGLAVGPVAGCQMFSGPEVVCTLELRADVRPAAQTIAVGQAFTATVALSSCGGRQHLTDVFTWQAQDPTVVDVDAVAGRITGKAPGETLVEVVGRTYGRLGAVRVTVTAPASVGRRAEPARVRAAAATPDVGAA